MLEFNTNKTYQLCTWHWKPPPRGDVGHQPRGKKKSHKAQRWGTLFLSKPQPSEDKLPHPGGKLCSLIPIVGYLEKWGACCGEWILTGIRERERVCETDSTRFAKPVSFLAHCPFHSPNSTRSVKSIVNTQDNKTSLSIVGIQYESHNFFLKKLVQI